MGHPPQHLEMLNTALLSLAHLTPHATPACGSQGGLKKEDKLIGIAIP